MHSYGGGVNGVVGCYCDLILILRNTTECRLIDKSINIQRFVNRTKLSKEQTLLAL